MTAAAASATGAAHFGAVEPSVAVMSDGRALGALRALLVIAIGDQRLVVPVQRTIACDLGLVDRLLTLALAARRAGWGAWLEQVEDDLDDLLGLVGVGRRLPGDRRSLLDGRGDRRAELDGPSDGAQSVV